MTYYPEGQSRTWFRLTQLLEKSQAAKLDSKTVPGNLCRWFWTQHSCERKCSSSCSLDGASETNSTGLSQTVCSQELIKTLLCSSLLTCNTTCCFNARCLLDSRDCCWYAESSKATLSSNPKYSEVGLTWEMWIRVLAEKSIGLKNKHGKICIKSFLHCHLLLSPGSDLLSAKPKPKGSCWLPTGRLKPYYPSSMG